MFGGAKPWAERNVAKKPCRSCAAVFQPKAGGSLYCNVCVADVKKKQRAGARRAWRARNPEKAAQYKTSLDLKQYGLSLADYTQMLDAQGGACAICKTLNPGGRGLHRTLAVDHCHATGRVRGLLCPRCNTGIGLFRDNPSLLRGAIQYLEGDDA